MTHGPVLNRIGPPRTTQLSWSTDAPQPALAPDGACIECEILITPFAVCSARSQIPRYSFQSPIFAVTAHECEAAGSGEGAGSRAPGRPADGPRGHADRGQTAVDCRPGRGRCATYRDRELCSGDHLAAAGGHSDRHAHGARIISPDLCYRARAE